MLITVAVIKIGFADRILSTSLKKRDCRKSYLGAPYEILSTIYQNIITKLSSGRY